LVEVVIVSDKLRKDGTRAGERRDSMNEDESGLDLRLVSSTSSSSKDGV
jgi:hypothetical protein